MWLVIEINDFEGLQEIFLALKMAEFALLHEFDTELFQGIDGVHGDLEIVVAADLVSE